MNEYQATAVMLGLFVLRCIVPLLLTMALVHLMNRLLDHWAATEDAVQHEALTPAAPPSMPAASAPSIACWLFHNCDDEKRARCAAFRRQGIPCWQARLIEEGKLPERCTTCALYTTALQGAA